jgi:hypothetical protein
MIHKGMYETQLLWLQSVKSLEVTPSHLIMRLTTDIPLKSTVTEIGAREWLSTDSST